MLVINDHCVYISWHFDFNGSPIGQAIFLSDIRTNEYYIVFASDTTLFSIQDQGFQFQLEWSLNLTEIFGDAQGVPVV